MMSRPPSASAATTRWLAAAAAVVSLLLAACVPAKPGPGGPGDLSGELVMYPAGSAEDYGICTLVFLSAATVRAGGKLGKSAEARLTGASEAMVAASPDPRLSMAAYRAYASYGPRTYMPFAKESLPACRARHPAHAREFGL